MRRSARACSSIARRVESRLSAALGQLQEGVVAPLVARRGAGLLGALLGVGELVLGPLGAVAQVGGVQVLDRKDLVDQHERVLAGHLQEPLALRVADDLGLRLVEPQLRGVEHRQQRLVVGQDADGAHARARGHHLDLVVEGLALRREDLDLERSPRHQRFFLAASTTSSILPLSRNADSGRSSCWPSRISLNERTVSAIDTYAPGVPVNASATWNGCDRKRSILRARWTSTRSSSESSSMPRMAMMSCSSR